MMPRALLVNPWIHDFSAYDFWARPLGLLELAAALREAGYELALLDCLDLFYPGRRWPWPRRKPDGSGKFDQEAIAKPGPLKSIPRRFKRYGMPVEAFRAAAASLDAPDVVLVSSVMTYWYTGVAETVAELKRQWPSAPVVLGGVYATLLPDHARAASGADAVAVGDWQRSLPGILAGLGLPSPVLDRDFFPGWDLYPRLSAAAVITGRGCPGRCPYCAVPVLHPRVWRRDPESVVEEIERLVKDHGVGDVAFFDDALRAGGDDHLVAVLEGALRRGWRVRFHAANALHLAGLSPELCGLLRRAGFATLRFGLETTDPERSKRLGSKAGLDDLHSACANLARTGYAPSEIGVFLMLGLPGQGPAEVEAGIKEVIRAGARPYLTEYSPVPGSPLWEEATAASRYDLAGEPLFHNNTLLSCAHPDLDEKAFTRLKVLARGPLRV